MPEAAPHLQRFLETFGDPEAVRSEIVRYWDNRGRMGTPQELYEHLINTRVLEQNISAGRATMLSEIFRDSFLPEETTGLINKHRLPLIDALSRLYIENFPTRPLFQVEGDIGNLGGLNRAMETAAKALQRNHPEMFKKQVMQYDLRGTPEEQAAQLARVKANETLGRITDIVHGALADIGYVTGIRKGGDEITFVVEPLQRSGSSEALKAATSKAQQAVEGFVRDAQLDGIAHLKYSQNPAEARARGGVSIGLGVVEASLEPSARQEALDAMIADSKAQRAEFRRAGSIPTSAPDIIALESALSGQETPVRRASVHRMEVFDKITAPTESLADARYAQITRLVSMVGGNTPISDKTRALIRGTSDLTRRVDAVTDLPLFDYMRGDQMLHFTTMHGNARLVLVDMSNMAGGNILGTEVGDAMGRQFALAVQAGMRDAGLEHLVPYLASRGGGKFALLVPENISETLIEGDLRDHIQRHINVASQSPLDLDESALASARAVAQKKQISLPHDGVHMAAIPNPKTGLTGVEVSIAMSSQAVSPHYPLDPPIEILTQRTEAMYQAKVAEKLAALPKPLSAPKKLGLGAAGLNLAAGPVIEGGLEAANGGSAGEIAAAAVKGLANGALPGVTEGFANITANHAQQNGLDQTLNGLSTVTQAGAVGGMIAAPATGGTSLVLAAGAGLANLGVGLVHDSTYVAGFSKQGGHITGLVETARRFNASDWLNDRDRSLRAELEVRGNSKDVTVLADADHDGKLTAREARDYLKARGQKLREDASAHELADGLSDEARTQAEAAASKIPPVAQTPLATPIAPPPAIATPPAVPAPAR